jgi:two-component system sensor histidine kinase YesM
MSATTFFSKMTLFKKNFILLFFSVSISIIVLGYLSYYRSSSQIETVTAAFLENNVQQNSQKLSEFFMDISMKSDSVIGDHQLQFLLEEQLRGKFNEYNFINSVFPIIDEIKDPFELKIFPVGINNYIDYLRRINAPQVNENTEWYQESLQLMGSAFWHNETGYADPFGSSVFSYIRTIRSMRDLKPLAVMTIGIPEQVIKKQLTLSPKYQNFDLLIIDANHHIIYPDNKRTKEKFQSDKLPMQPAATYSGVQIHDIDRMFVALSPIENTDWWLVAMIPMEDLVGPIKVIREFSLIIIVVSLTVITIFLAYITNKFTSPIKTVVYLMKRVELGDFTFSKQFLTRSDEIGQLARGYNSMVSGMQNLISTTKQVGEEKRELEMKILINQINPHFLYNTLDSIKWKADQSGQMVISEMVDSLASLLRFSISDGEIFTTVEREIEHVKCYLKIEQMRNNHSFQVMMQIQPAIHNMPLLRLTLQPIVENSIKHGVNKLDHGKGKIAIQMFRQGDKLICIVEDNGPGSTKGLQKDFLINKGSFETGGVGLFNVNRRLKIQYGEQYGITTENLDGKGFRVTLSHPVQ